MDKQQNSLQSGTITFAAKGLVTDYSPLMQPKETYSFALNTVISDLEGNTGLLSNEESNTLFVTYTPTFPLTNPTTIVPLPSCLYFETIIDINSVAHVFKLTYSLTNDNTYIFSSYEIDHVLQTGYPLVTWFINKPLALVYFSTTEGGEFYIDSHYRDYGKLLFSYNTTYHRYQCTDTNGDILSDIINNLTVYFYRVEEDSLVTYNILR